VICAALCGASITSCVHNENSEDEWTDKRRTVLVYISGDNSLSNYADMNIKSMIQGSGENVLNDVNLLVYVDKSSTPPCLLHITPDEETGVMIADTVQWYDEQNSASVEVMRGVLENVFGPGSPYNTKQRGLVLWSHGTAWLPSDMSSNYLRAFGEDKHDETGDIDSWFNVSDLKAALEGYKFEFIIFDACYMGSIEVAYALKDFTPYIVGSPTEIMGAGMPYQYMIPDFFGNNVEASMINIGKTFYDYYQAQTGVYQSGSIGVIKTSALNSLASATNDILKGREEDIYKLDASKIQCLEYLNIAPHVLYDFADYVRQMANDAQYTSFQKALDAAVLYQNTTEEAYFNNGGMRPLDATRFCGVSCYLPRATTTKLNDWYKQLDWYNAAYQ
jgi:hypothetical protein